MAVLPPTIHTSLMMIWSIHKWSLSRSTNAGTFKLMSPCCCAICTGWAQTNVPYFWCKLKVCLLRQMLEILRYSWQEHILRLCQFSGTFFLWFSFYLMEKKWSLRLFPRAVFSLHADNAPIWHGSQSTDDTVQIVFSDGVQKTNAPTMATLHSSNCSGAVSVWCVLTEVQLLE